jgi:hypothetical protein
VRAAELQRWIQAGGYDAIVNGEYPRRGSGSDKPLTDEYAEAAGYYGDKMKGVINQVADAARRATNTMNNAFRDRDE